jgi:hypothetical protein
MKTSKFLLFFLLISFLGHGQSPCVGFSATKYYMGDNITISCDTLYLLNKLTFKRFNAVYKDPKLSELIATQDELIQVYEKRTAEQDEAYRDLKDNFEKVVNNSNLLIQTSKEELSGIKQSLESAQQNIDGAKTDIGEVKDLLKKDLHKANREKIKWVFGGLALGVLVMVIGGSK